MTAAATVLPPPAPGDEPAPERAAPQVPEPRRRHFRPALLLALWFAAVAAYSCYPILRPRTKVLATLANDLANHVRHVYEYGLALKERQFPPVVAPVLDAKIRLPLFQYYSGTSYLVPGVANVFGMNPYGSLKLGVFVHVLAAGAFTYAACRALGVPRAAALVAGTAYELYPFSSGDFYVRGSWTEFAALHAVPMVFFTLVRLVQSRTRAQTLAWLSLSGLAWAYFVPLHPVQTMLCGALMAAAVTAYALVDRRASWPALVKLAASAALGAAASAWFWVPIARDYGDLRIVPHATFMDAGLADPGILLWPAFREPAAWPWAPQVGFHFVVAAVIVVVLFKDGRALGITCAAALAAILLIILLYNNPHLEWVRRLLKPLQWSYRLLIPAALAGTVCLALALAGILRRLRDPWAQGAAFGLTLAYIVGTSVPYFLGSRKWQYSSRLREIVAPDWQAPNSTGSYALRGTDYRLLRLVRSDGTLNVNADLPIPFEGYPTEVQLLLRKPDGAPESPGAVPTASVGISPAQLRREGAAEPVPGDPSRLRLAFTFRPQVGHTPGDTMIRFDAPAAQSNWPVEDLTFHAAADPPTMICRLPAGAARTDEGKRTRFALHVPPGREAMYQFPVCTLPSNAVKVNGATTNALPSANRSMVIVPLRAGPNVVKIRTRPAPPAWWASAVATASMLACAGLTGARGARGRAGENSILGVPSE